MCYNDAIFGALISPEIYKVPKDPFFFKIVGVFFTKLGNFQSMGLISLGGAARV